LIFKGGTIHLNPEGIEFSLPLYPTFYNIEEFLQKLAPCIERCDLDACVEAAAWMAREMGMGAQELLDLSSNIGSHIASVNYILNMSLIIYI